MSRVPWAAFALAAIVVVTFVASCDSAGSSREATVASGVPSVPQPSSQAASARPQNTKRLDAGDLVDALSRAGLTVEPRGAAQLSVDDVSRFPEEHRSSIVLRLADGQGNAETMTFVEFGSWKAAAEMDAKPINGFAARNWFVIGTVSNYFVDAVRDALAH